MNLKDNMDELLVTYLLGEATEAEAQQAKDWINANNEHRQYFAALRLLWNESKQLKTTSKINEQEAWDRFKQRTQSAGDTKTIAVTPFFNIQRIAAAILLIAACSWGAYYIVNQGSIKDVAINASAINEHTMKDTAQPASAVKINPVNVNIGDDTDLPGTPAVAGKSATKKKDGALHRTIKFDEKAIGFKKHDKALYTSGSYAQSEAICNSTPCPIEICINQTMKCPENKPAEISSCSLLEPDQSVKVNYKSKDKIAKNCSLSVEEITITSIATGEAITLNDHSTPSTAQDLFRYISGEKKGDILAGVFHADCNNQTGERSLKFDNKTGNWVLE